MASLHKDPRGKSPFWYVAYTAPDGRRAFKSTGQRDRKKAQEICRALERATEQARAGELTEIRVRKLLDDVLESIGQSPVRSESVRSFFNHWLAGKRISVKASVARQYTSTVIDFLASLGDKADRPLAGVVARDVAAYRDLRLATGISAGTLEHDLTCIRSVLASACNQGLILHNPAKAVERPKHRALTRDVFSAEELRALLRSASEEWKTLILCAYYLGGRLSDMVALSWDSVDLTIGTIRFTQSKTGGQLEIPIHPELEERLLALAGEQRDLLCPTLAKTRTGGRCGLSNQFQRLMAEAGIDRQQEHSGQYRLSRKSFHGLRHSFTSALANLGTPPEVRMLLTGHKSLDIHRRYTHLELQPLRTAVNSLPRLLP